MELSTHLRVLGRSLVLAVAVMGAFTLAGCKGDARKEGATVVRAPPEPLVAPPRAPAAAGVTQPSGPTTDRGDRLERPRPVGALAPEVAPNVP